METKESAVQFTTILAGFLYDSVAGDTPTAEPGLRRDIERAVMYGINGVLESPRLNVSLLLCVEPTVSLVTGNSEALKPRYLRAPFDTQDKRPRSTADVLTELDTMHFLMPGAWSDQELAGVLVVPWRVDLYVAFQKLDGDMWAKRIFPLTTQTHIDVAAFTEGYRRAGKSTAIKKVRRVLGEHLPLLTS
jgi:hypothetical protein